MTNNPTTNTGEPNTMSYPAPVTNVRSSARVAIVTKYHGPTNHRGSRVIAKRGDHTTGDKTYTHHWDHALDIDDNHAAAVAGLVARYGWNDPAAGWRGQWHTASITTGYVAVFVPDPLARARELTTDDHALVARFERPTDRDDALRTIREQRAAWAGANATG